LLTAKSRLFVFSNLQPLLPAAKRQPFCFQALAASFAKNRVFFGASRHQAAKSFPGNKSKLLASLVP
jgi:hypothetical protein